MSEAIALRNATEVALADAVAKASQPAVERRTCDRKNDTNDTTFDEATTIKLLEVSEWLVNYRKSLGVEKNRV